MKKSEPEHLDSLLRAHPGFFSAFHRSSLIPSS
jgi:hypothetical protein